MTAWIIIAAIIAVFWILLSFSFTVYVHITDEVSIKLGAYGIKFAVVPPKEREKKPKKHKGKATDDKKKSETKPKKKVDKLTFGETVETVMSMIKAILKPTGKMMSHIRITHININIAVCGDEADKTAIKFGEITAAIYSVLGYLNQLIKVKIKCVDIRPDFVGDEDRYDIIFRVKLRLGYILVAALSILFRFFGNIIRVKLGKSNQNNINNTQDLKGDKQHEQSSN